MHAHVTLMGRKKGIMIGMNTLLGLAIAIAVVIILIMLLTKYAPPITMWADDSLSSLNEGLFGGS